MTDLPNLNKQDQEMVCALVSNILKALPYELYVFGSRSKNKACKPHSDLDLAIKSANKIPREVLFQLEESLEESNLNYRADLIDLQRISDEFKQTIKMDLVLLYKN